MSRKSLFVFVIVAVALSLSGYWLDHAGYLHVPRIFDVPSALGGSAAGGSEGMGERLEGGPPAGEFAGLDPGTARPDFDEGAMSDRGEGDRHGGGLSERTVMSMVSNVWWLAITIILVGYVMRGVALVKAQLRRARRSAVTPT